MSEWIRPAEAAKMLGVSPVSASRYAKQGHLEMMLTPGRQVLINRQSVEDWVARRRPVGPNVTVIEPR